MCVAYNNDNWRENALQKSRKGVKVVRKLEVEVDAFDGVVRVHSVGGGKSENGVQPCR
jgi:hypothetical protein